MDGSAADQGSEPGGEKIPRTPLLALAGFSGSLERLLALARAQRIDLARLSLPELVNQLAAALRRAPAATALGEKADWLVMAAWLLHLRSQLLLPAGTAAQQAGEQQADRLRGQLAALEKMQALAGWLNCRPRLGSEVFARGQPELFGLFPETAWEIDVIEFLWASLALFDEGGAEEAKITARWRPARPALHAVAEARQRILGLLAAAPAGLRLEELLPAPAAAEPALRRRSAWSSTFLASLELARLGEVILIQPGPAAPVHARLAAGDGGMDLPQR